MTGARELAREAEVALRRAREAADAAGWSEETETAYLAAHDVAVAALERVAVLDGLSTARQAATDGRHE